VLAPAKGGRRNRRFSRGGKALSANAVQQPTAETSEEAL